MSRLRKKTRRTTTHHPHKLLSVNIHIVWNQPSSLADSIPETFTSKKIRQSILLQTRTNRNKGKRILPYLTDPIPTLTTYLHFVRWKQEQDMLVAKFTKILHSHLVRQWMHARNKTTDKPEYILYMHRKESWQWHCTNLRLCHGISGKLFTVNILQDLLYFNFVHGSAAIHVVQLISKHHQLVFP